jgi:hypothetical protein
VILTSKAIFLKSWLWSLIGAAVVVAVFWIITDFIHVFQNLHSLTEFTNILLCLSIVGNIAGAGLVLWRVAEKYYASSLKKTIKRYIFLSFCSLLVAVAIILTSTPLAILVIAWNLVAPLCVIKALPILASH